SVTITSAATDTLRIQASNRDPSELRGNVPWQESGGMATNPSVGASKATISVFSQGPVAVYRQ
ncbi:MAG: hypothetical protein ACM3ZQ_08265, partial [Bacillota bacterium]